MDFLENAKNVIVETADVVAKKTGELVEVAKIKYAILELKNDVKKLYNEIGRLTYLSVEKGQDNVEAIKLKCEIISSKLEKIRQLEDDAGKPIFRCPVCDKPADSTDEYCPSCGANMTVNAEVVTEDADTENTDDEAVTETVAEEAAEGDAKKADTDNTAKTENGDNK